MSVNWFTVAAQIANFLILVWLLKRFLYKPILTAMHKRQQRVQDQLEEAATLAKSAAKEKEQYLTLQEEVREQGKNELLKARREADDLRKKLFQEVETESKAAHLQWQNELASEKELFLKKAGIQLGKQFHLFAQSAFRDLAAADFEDYMVVRFCQELDKDGVEPDFFGQLQNPEKLRVYTAFALSSDSKKALRELLWSRLSEQPEISFGTDPKLIAGILVSSDDHKLEWNLHQYLDNFQVELEKIFAKESR